MNKRYIICYELIVPDHRRGQEIVRKLQKDGKQLLPHAWVVSRPANDSSSNILNSLGIGSDCRFLITCLDDTPGCIAGNFTEVEILQDFHEGR